MSRILLVSPRFDSEFSRAGAMAGVSYQVADVPQSLMIPLHLATISALTPDDFEVDIWDEGAKGELTPDTDLGKDYDLVGVTGYLAHIPRAVQIAKVVHGWGLPVVVGGPGVSGAPEQCRGVFDVIFLGEAELTWPRFLREWKKGIHRSEYRQVERPDLATSPVPRWGNVTGDVSRYRLGGVQTTRGCPWDCEFCDVIHLFGRKPRHKPIDRVIEEIVQLEKLGQHRVFMCDDDFIGSRKYAKELLRELIPVNNGFKAPLSFSTQLTIDLARDDELMELMADCNFGQALIGIETPRAASLSEANKVQNLRGDLVADCRKIQSYGIAVKAALIVGFDADDVDVFDEQIKFLEDANIPISTINTIKAYPGTPLWLRLQRENRVIDVSDIYSDSPKVVTNVLPKRMSRVELLEGYRRLLEHARSWDSIKRRMVGFVNDVARQPQVPPPSPEVRQERMGRAREFLGALAEEVRNPIIEIITHVMQTKPFMMEKAAVLLMQNLMDATVLPYMKEVIEQQIEHAEAGNIRIDHDPSAGLLPDGFHVAVKDVLPMVYRRLAGEIEYKQGVSEALVAVIKDFLIRWGASFEKFEDYHCVYLNELCDRHVERWNSQDAEPSRSDGNGEAGAWTALTDDEVKASRFIKEVLVGVEQEMRGQTRTPKAEAKDVSLEVLRVES